MDKQVLDHTELSLDEELGWSMALRYFTYIIAFGILLNWHHKKAWAAPGD